MARRPKSETILTKQELEDFTRRLSMLSVQGIEHTYQTAYSECRFDGKTIPPAAAVQQLVCAWRTSDKMDGTTGLKPCESPLEHFLV
jgi:hypothetical protein